MPYTLVTFHAHPDDEAIATAGTMAKAAAAGHRVVLVVATRGEHGEVAPEFLEPGESLAERRVEETRRAAALLGVARVEFLGYVDSGMAGTPENDRPGSFWSADVDEAARRLARILEEESADVLTVYDERGTYGHPDHVQVHRVGVKAGELAGTPRIYEATVDREYLRALMRERRDEISVGEGAPDPDLFDIGVPSERITTVVDVRAETRQKRAAMAAHASQIPENSFFLALPDDAFDLAFGQEWFIRRDGRPSAREHSLFDGLRQGGESNGGGSRGE
ncbi:MAG: PIG-L family deacetylase [Actinobacteria bacterium]|nr:PIG-L family deacetylase [Actinomycetota bacterium]